MSHETGRSTTADPSTVTERDQFANFLEIVLGDYTFSGHREWENNTLERFLDGLASFAEARVLGTQDQETPTWQLFAQMIVAATGYE